jgi:WD40 repeat protein
LLRQFGERHEYVTGSDKLLWIRSIAISPDGQLLVTAGSERQIHFWHMAAGKEKTSLESAQESVDCLAFSPDARVLASGATDRTLCLWELTSGKLRQRFKAHRSAITSVQFAPDGKRLATGSMDSTAAVWDLKPMSQSAQVERGLEKLRSDDHRIHDDAMIDLSAILPMGAIGLDQSTAHQTIYVFGVGVLVFGLRLVRFRRCPRCRRLVDGYFDFAKGLPWINFQCKSCGAYFRWQES